MIKDNQKHISVLYKRTEYPDMSFMGGEYLIFLIKKSENFVRAIYLITNFLSDNEPLKWRLRTSATELIERVMSFIKEERNKASEYLYRAHFFGCLSFLISLLNVGEESGAISGANATLLKREISSFFPIFQDKIFSLRIKQDALPIAPEPAVSTRRSKTARYLSRAERRESRRQFAERILRPLENKSTTENVLEKSKGQEKSTVTKEMSVTKNTSKIKTEQHIRRQQAIVSVLKDKKQLTVREMMSVINGYGEKTIQRELVALVEKGILKKMGQKRWSSYAFVQPFLFEGSEKRS